MKHYELVDLVFKAYDIDVLLSSVDLQVTYYETPDIDLYTGEVEGQTVFPSSDYLLPNSHSEEHEALIQSVLNGNPWRSMFPDIDEECTKTLSSYSISINQVVEVFAMTNKIAICKPKQLVHVYETLEKLSNSIRRMSFNSANFRTPPEEDTVKISNLLDALEPMVTVIETNGEDVTKWTKLQSFQIDTGFKFDNKSQVSNVDISGVITVRKKEDIPPGSPVD